jgi:carbonic anhydrase
MRLLKHLFENNRAWAGNIRQSDPEFFSKLARQQSPEYLWIGCSDSRVPANQIVGLLPGEMFVHRNLANVVVHSDLNCMSVLQFAVDVLKIRHIIVCGHYGCAGVLAAERGHQIGLANHWLQHVAAVRQKHAAKLSEKTPAQRADRLCELNVIEQVMSVSNTPICDVAWKRSQPLAIHGWIYSIEDGLLHDLRVTVSGFDEAEEVYQAAISGLNIGS